MTDPRLLERVIIALRAVCAGDYTLRPATDAGLAKLAEAAIDVVRDYDGPPKVEDAGLREFLGAHSDFVDMVLFRK